MENLQKFQVSHTEKRVLKNGPIPSFFAHFHPFHTTFLNESVDTNGIRTWIVRVESEHADHNHSP